MATFNKYHAGVLGTGFYVPDNVLTNADLERMVNTNDEWITERTGIKERRFVDEGVPVSSIAMNAAQNALDDSGVSASELDMIIVATFTSDMRIPTTSCLLQHRLGATNAAAFDLSAACSGFTYAMAMASQFVENGTYKNILVIGAETLSKYTNYEDRNTCILFGDGAGAAVIGRVEEGYGILSFDLGSDGAGGEFIKMPSSGSLCPVTAETIENKENLIYMDGKAVYKFAIHCMGDTIEKSLEKIGMSKSDIDWFVPHQANIRIIQSAAKRFSMPMDKVIVNIHKYGNMSAASIPVALAEAAKEKKFKKGDIIALSGFGAGLTWGSCILRWSKED